MPSMPSRWRFALVALAVLALVGCGSSKSSSSTTATTTSTTLPAPSAPTAPTTSTATSTSTVAPTGSAPAGSGAVQVTGAVTGSFTQAGVSCANAGYVLEAEGYLYLDGKSHGASLKVTGSDPGVPSTALITMEVVGTNPSFASLTPYYWGTKSSRGTVTASLAGATLSNLVLEELVGATTGPNIGTVTLNGSVTKCQR